MIEENINKTNFDKLDKREFIRLVKSIPATFRVNDGFNRIKEYKTVSKNISRCGMFIEEINLKKELFFNFQSKQNIINILINLPEWAITLKAIGKIVWVKDSNKSLDEERGLEMMGIKFVEISDDDINKLMLYISAELKRQEREKCFSTKIELSTIIKKNKEVIYDLLKNMECFSQFMKDVRKVEIVKRIGNTVLTEWEIMVEDVCVLWKQETIYDDKNMVIKFKMIEGDFDRYEGEWTLQQLLTGTHIYLSVYIDWGIPALEKYIKTILEKKAQDILQRMLKAIKKKLWTKKVSKLVKFAFIIHPLDINLIPISFGEQFLMKKRSMLVEKICEWFPSFECSHITGIRSLTGKAIEGELIYCPLLSTQIINLDPKLVLKKLIEAGEIAKKSGAKILGLGAYTSMVGKKGILINKALDIPVTTGTSYTIAITIEAALKIAQEIGIKINQLRVTVIGATGGIGKVCSEILSDKVRSLTLVARNKTKLNNLSDFISKSNNVKIETTSDINKAISNVDMVITATSTPTAIIDVNLLQSGTVVCDVSRPRNVSEKDANLRDDILVIDGGLVRPPLGNVQCDFYIGLPPGLIYSCIAETMILALEERYECYSIGGNITASKVKEISQLGSKHGFSLASLRSFDKEITKDYIEKIKKSLLKRKEKIK